MVHHILIGGKDKLTIETLKNGFADGWGYKATLDY
jgi:hypothetical protein